MIEINGKSAFNALAMGPLHFLNFEQKVIKRLKTDDPNGELERLKNAQEKAKEELSNLYQKALCLKLTYNCFTGGVSIHTAEFAAIFINNCFISHNVNNR